MMNTFQPSKACMQKMNWHPLSLNTILLDKVCSLTQKLSCFQQCIQYSSKTHQRSMFLENRWYNLNLKHLIHSNCYNLNQRFL